MKKADTDFSRRLLDLRTAAKLTQEELAHRAGVSRAAIARFEGGTREPTWLMVQKLCRGLGVLPLALADPAIVAPPSAAAKRARK